MEPSWRGWPRKGSVGSNPTTLHNLINGDRSSMVRAPDCEAGKLRVRIPSVTPREIGVVVSRLLWEQENEGSIPSFRTADIAKSGNARQNPCPHCRQHGSMSKPV